MPFTISFRAGLAALTVAIAPVCAHAASLYGGGGTIGAEVGVGQAVGESVALRLDVSTLAYSRDFNTSGVDYDARYKATTANVYADWFFYDNVRLSGGALIGDRKIHGTARSLGGTVNFNGVPYTTTAADMLAFDARFPKVTPYLGLGYGHREASRGFGFYVDAGVAYGQPRVTLSPSASLVAKVNPTDLAVTQASVQDEADRLRVYPVLKAGLSYAF